MYLKKKTPDTMKKTIRYQLQWIEFSTLSTSVNLSDSTSSNVQNVTCHLRHIEEENLSSQKSDPISNYVLPKEKKQIN